MVNIQLMWRYMLLTSMYAVSVVVLALSQDPPGLIMDGYECIYCDMQEAILLKCACATMPNKLVQWA